MQNAIPHQQGRQRGTFLGGVVKRDTLTQGRLARAERLRNSLARFKEPRQSRPKEQTVNFYRNPRPKNGSLTRARIGDKTQGPHARGTLAKVGAPVGHWAVVTTHSGPHSCDYKGVPKQHTPCAGGAGGAHQGRFAKFLAKPRKEHLHPTELPSRFVSCCRRQHSRSPSTAQRGANGKFLPTA